jgi:phenylalanyl-tRNA synthetase beta chain
MTGRREPEGWAQSSGLVDFYDLKGTIENVLTAFGLEHVRFAAIPTQPYLHPGKSCTLTTEDGALLGYLGEVHPRTLSAFDIEQPVYLLDLDAEELLCRCVSRRSFTPLSRFPDVSRDTALLVDEEVRAEQILDILRQHQARTVEDLTLFDLYIGKGIPQGKKSIGVRIRYRDMTKTLTEKEVGKAHDRMISTLCEKLAAEIR